jgi:hypothetical protein
MKEISSMVFPQYGVVFYGHALKEKKGEVMTFV